MDAMTREEKLEAALQKIVKPSKFPYVSREFKWAQDVAKEALQNAKSIQEYMG